MEPVWSIPSPITVTQGVPQSFDVSQWVAATYPLILSLAGTLPAGFAFAGVTLAWDGTGPAGEYEVDGLFSAEPNLDKMVTDAALLRQQNETLQDNLAGAMTAAENEQKVDDSVKANVSALAQKFASDAQQLSQQFIEAVSGL